MAAGRIAYSPGSFYLAWVLSTCLSGRAAYIHVGAAIGTVMVANVFRVIIPAQKDLVNAVTGESRPRCQQGPPGTATFKTQQLLHPAGAVHHDQRPLPGNLWSCAELAGAGGLLTGRRGHPALFQHPAFTRVPGLAADSCPAVAGWSCCLSPHLSRHRLTRTVIQQPPFRPARFTPSLNSAAHRCHARVPSFEGFTSAPLGVELDSPQKLEQYAERVYQTVVVTRIMPLANLTQMTDSRA